MKIKSRYLWIGASVLVVVAIAVPVVLTTGSDPGPAPVAGSVDQPHHGATSVTDPRKYGINIPAGPPHQYATDVGDVASADPRALLWAVLKRQG